MPRPTPTRVRPLALLAALCGAVTGTTAQPRPANADIIDRVVAVIDDEAIFLSDVARRLRPFERQLEQIADTRERAFRRECLYGETLERMVDDMLIRRAATRAHLTVTDADVDHMIEGVARQRNATPADIYAALEQEGLTRTEYRTFMEAEVLRLRVINVRVRGRVQIGQSEVADEYRRRVRTATDRAPFHAAHVFLAFPENPSSAQVVATQQRAEEVAARARAGEDFAVLARQSSDDAATRDAGGDLGTVDPSDTENAPPTWLVNALRGLTPGQTSGAVRGENGYHVFRLIEREPVAIPPLTEVHTDLYNDLVNHEMARQQTIYLRELRQRSAVVVRMPVSPRCAAVPRE